MNTYWLKPKKAKENYESKKGNDVDDDDYEDDYEDDETPTAPSSDDDGFEDLDDFLSSMGIGPSK